MTIKANHYTLPRPRLSLQDNIELRPEVFDKSTPSQQQVVPHHETEILPSRVVDFGHAAVEYTLERPLEETRQTPIVIVNGFGGIKSAYRDLRHTLATDNGIPAITISPVRLQKRSVSLHSHYRGDYTALPSRSIYAVAKDIDVNYGIDEFDIAAHSMGGKIATNFSLRHPELVRTLHLLGAAGLEDHSFLKILARIPRFFSEEIAPNKRQISDNYAAKVIAEELYYMYRRPGRTVREIKGVTHCDIRPDLDILRSNGIAVSIINFAADCLIKNLATQAELEDRVDFCGTHPNPLLGHLALQLAAKEVADFVMQVTQNIHTEASN